MMQIKMVMVLHASSSKPTINRHGGEDVLICFSKITHWDLIKAMAGLDSSGDRADYHFHSTEYRTAPTLIPDHKLDSYRKHADRSSAVKGLPLNCILILTKQRGLFLRIYDH